MKVSETGRTPSSQKPAGRESATSTTSRPSRRLVQGPLRHVLRQRQVPELRRSFEASLASEPVRRGGGGNVEAR